MIKSNNHNQCTAISKNVLGMKYMCCEYIKCLPNEIIVIRIT